MPNLVHGVTVVEVHDGVRPITTARTGVVGIAGTAPDASSTDFPLNTPKLVTSLAQAKALITDGDPDADGGTLLDAVEAVYAQVGALCVLVRVDDTLEDDVELEVGAAAASAFRAAESAVGVKPRILCAPGYGGNDVNDLLAGLGAAAKHLRAIVVLDGADTDQAGAISHADGITGNLDRIYLVDPSVTVGGGTRPASAYAAGVIARMDNERGFWWSPSNQVINGISGTARPIDFALGDSTSEADILNGGHIATIVRKNGFRLWGNRTLDKTDPKWKFLSVRRIADVLNDTLLENHLWAVDRNITRTYLENVSDGVNAYIRQLVALGAILGGRCIPSPDLNTPEAIASGQVYFDFEFTPSTPAEKLTFRSALVNDYIEEIL